LPIGRSLFTWFACLSALLLLFLGANLNPLAYLLAGVLTPLPVLLAGRQAGERPTLALVLAAAAFILVLQPGLAGLWHNLGFLNLLLMGFLLVSLQLRGLSAPQAIIYTVVILGLVALLFVVGQALVSGRTLATVLAEKSTELMATVRQVLGEDSTSSFLIPGISQADVEATIRKLLPGLLVTNTGLVAWLNVILSRQAGLLTGQGEAETPLFFWAVPEWLIFGILGSGFLLLVPVAGVRLIGLNLLMILAVVYFFQGVAVVASWFHRLGLPRFLRIIGYPVLFLNPFFLVIVTLGILDLWLDFRRLHQPKGA
jgi:uncharacterized protein YybS (DUF2232 family)